MDEYLKEALSRYKRCTLKLIEALEMENFDDLELLLNSRQEVIDGLKDKSYTDEEFTSLSRELQILVLEQKLNILMRSKRNGVKKEIDKLSEVKSANKSYNRHFDVDALYFNNRI